MRGGEKGTGGGSRDAILCHSNIGQRISEELQ